MHWNASVITTLKKVENLGELILDFVVPALDIVFVRSIQIPIEQIKMDIHLVVTRLTVAMLGIPTMAGMKVVAKPILILVTMDLFVVVIIRTIAMMAPPCDLASITC